MDGESGRNAVERVAYALFAPSADCGVSSYCLKGSSILSRFTLRTRKLTRTGSKPSSSRVHSTPASNHAQHDWHEDDGTSADHPSCLAIGGARTARAEARNGGERKHRIERRRLDQKVVERNGHQLHRDAKCLSHFRGQRRSNKSIFPHASRREIRSCLQRQCTSCPETSS